MSSHESSRNLKNGKIMWLSGNNIPISCNEKLKILEENLEDLQQLYQDVLEDALLMGCTKESFNHNVYRQLFGEEKK